MVKLFPPNTRTEFIDLVCAGMSIDRAARRVGAAGATGTAWWSQSGRMSINMGMHGGLVDPAPDVDIAGDRTLTAFDRGMIQMGRRSGLSYAEIGKSIGRNKSV
ncbi:helix-turn-helix domain-containing protein, partial [Cryobacterium levicorallinum]